MKPQKKPSRVLSNAITKKYFLVLIISLSVFPALNAQNDATKVAERVYNICDYGAIGDGVTLNTLAIQNTINECSKHGGGEVVVPAGNFVTGSVRLFSNINFNLEAGSVITGSLEDKDYLYQENFGFSGSGAGTKIGILFAQDAENVSLTGQGVINGQGEHFMYPDSLQSAKNFVSEYTRQGKDYMNPKFGRKDGPVMWKGTYEERPGTMVIFSNCKNVQVRDITFKASPNWTMHFLNCHEVKASGITINNNMDIPNSDGIDMYDSKNIVISDCIINAGDDAIAVISSENLTVDNCVLHSRSCGIRIGYNVFNDRNSGNLIFNNIRIYDSNRGIGIFQRREGDMKNMVFSNFIIDTRLHSGQWWGHGEPIHISAVPGLGSKKVGKVSNVRFSNIIATAETGVVIYGSKESVLEDIVLKDVNITIQRGNLSESYGGNFDLRPTNDISMGIFRHDVPAVYACYVKNLDIRNLQINWGQNISSYFTSAVECDDFNGVKISGLDERNLTAQIKNHSVIYLHNGQNADVKNIITEGIKRTLLLQQKVINLKK